MGMLQQKYWVDLIKGKYLAVASQGLREPSAPANKMELGSDANPAPTAPANSYSVSATPAKVAPHPKMRDAMLPCKDTMPIWVRGLMRDCCDVFPNKMTEYRYAFAPPGRGIDTHRFYETLLLGAVPIVVRSSLDELYKPFPVVFIDSWDELMARNVTQKWYDDIVGRFGKEPLSSTGVQERLRQKYWVDLIKRRSQEAELASH